MPELSDVEGFKRYFNRHAAGRTIRRVEVVDPPMLRGGSVRGLAGERFDRARRHGKWLLAPAGRATVLMHFGMSGLLRWSGGEPAPRHPHDRVVFDLAGGELRFRDMRKFGGVWIARDAAAVDALVGPLGPDALEVDRERFAELLAGRRGSVKAALMDQTVIAGLGNLLVDEICWRARIAPALPLRRLGAARRDRLHACMEAVLRESIPRGRIPGDPGWLTGARDERPGACPRCGAALRRATVAGRTTVWCGACQPGR